MASVSHCQGRRGLRKVVERVHTRSCLSLKKMFQCVIVSILVFGLTLKLVIFDGDDGNQDLPDGALRGLVRFDKVGVVGHHNWPSDKQGMVVAILPSRKVALVSNEPLVVTDAPEGENVINMFVHKHDRGWRFEKTIFTCPPKFAFIKFKVSGDGKSLIVGCGSYGKLSLARMLYFHESTLAWSLDSFSFDEKFQGFGFDMAISHDGRIFAIGSPKRGKGIVYVVERTWYMSWRSTEIIPLDLEDYERFGASIAISEDGNTIAVTAAAPFHSAVAIVFQRTDSASWQQLNPKLGSGSPAFTKYASPSLALAQNGQTLAFVAGRLTNSSEKSVLIFDRTSAGGWHERRILVPGDSVGFGDLGPIIMSMNGYVILTCAPFDNQRRGACWVFSRHNSNSDFIQQGPKYQTINDEKCGTPCLAYMFGQSAHMLSDGSAVIIGGREHPDQCSDDYTSGCFGGGANIYQQSFRDIQFTDM